MLIACAGCSPDAVSTEPTVSEAPLAPTTTLESVVIAGFGTHVSSVESTRTEGEFAQRRVGIVLASVPTRNEIDTAVTGVLAYLASEDSSRSPISVSVVGNGLPLSVPHSNWGAFYYEWGTNPRQPDGTRGPTIWLHESETDPPGTSYDSFYTGSIRGVWNDVDIETLSEWATNGAPQPEPWNP